LIAAAPKIIHYAWSREKELAKYQTRMPDYVALEEYIALLVRSTTGYRTCDLECQEFIQGTFREMQSLFTIEEFYLLGYNAVQSAESQPTFLSNKSPPSSELKSKPSRKPA
jgi:hypothetical protein